MSVPRKAPKFRKLKGKTKILVIFVHTLYILSAFVIVGLIVYVHKVEVEDFQGIQSAPEARTTRRILFAATCFRILASCLGYYGACRHHTPCLIFSYGICVTIVGLLNLITGISSTDTSETMGELRRGLMELMAHYDVDSRAERLLDRIQRDYMCCGTDDYRDWQTVNFGLTSLKVPPSCCLPDILVYENGTNMVAGSDEYDYCGQNLLPEDEDADKLIRTRGCLGAVSQVFRKYLKITGIMALCIGLLDLAVVILSIVLVIKKLI